MATGGEVSAAHRKVMALSAGRLHGYGFLHEGATQMWGQAGERQITTPPEVGIIGAGGGNTCGCLLLVRE